MSESIHSQALDMYRSLAQAQDRIAALAAAGELAVATINTMFADNERLEAENARLKAVCNRASIALQALPVDCMGVRKDRGQRGPFIRDELIAALEAVYAG